MLSIHLYLCVTPRWLFLYNICLPMCLSCLLTCLCCCPGQVHQRLPGYTRAQIHSRWNVINPQKKVKRFSLEEDEVFIKVRVLVMVLLLFAMMAVLSVLAREEARKK